ncbi:MAG: chemotaxis protein CheW [Pseudomonadota bacterium]|jgi:purine-binding chemotaxis protein CheW|uniref:chemotaxis protein CheW n=3 Tax=Burkholderiales TaxID=80840 RepID=UPI0010F4E0A0|nr:chemotaxis protein CheW [Burkholderia sp. 4M9327F10]
MDINATSAADAAAERAVEPAAEAAVELYGSFHLGGTELALPVAALQEVVGYPAAVTPVPLAPGHLLGIFNLRGTLIPIVDLRQLLHLPDDAVRAASKVAIVELGDARVGLQFDTTGEILRVPAAQKIVFDRADHAAPIICGALKLNGGERILQILCAAALLGLPDVPQLHHRATAPERRAQQAQRRQTVSFRVADAHLALPMAAIQEIIRVPAMHPSPLADAICIGMLNLRGTTVPVIDFARFMGLARDGSAAPQPAGTADERRIVVLNQRDVHVGLLVDEVRSIVGYRDDELLAMPVYSRRHVTLFAGCLGNEGRDSIILVNPEALCSHEQITAVAQGHRELYRDRTQAGGVPGGHLGGKAGDNAGHGRRGAGGARETYVTFRLGHLLGVRIGQLREVIDYSSEVVVTPGAPPYVRGVLHLRRELLTVVDVRALYGMPPYDDLGHAKILIVEYRGEKYGLVVDAVDNIVTIEAASRIPVPAMLTRQLGNGWGNGMTEAVELPGRGTLMLIDLATLCERVAAEAQV